MRDSHPDPSSNLLHGLPNRDPAAWHRLVHFYAPIVGRWARWGGLQDADVDNVVQEVFQG
jgi:hypothetical protein